MPVDHRFGKLTKLIDRVIHDEDNVNLIDSTPLLFMHLSLIGLFFVGFSWVAFWTCAGLYLLRVFALTGGYHRYFSHNSFKTSRAFQFILAFVGGMSAQLGALWWAAHHRHHHLYSDQKEEIAAALRRSSVRAEAAAALWEWSRRAPGKARFRLLNRLLPLP
jgi:fatty-acid desaturase